MSRLSSNVTAIAALADPVRRSLYEYVASRGVPVGRDEAARACSIGRTLAAFHLDRLVAENLLEVSYRRLSGKTGPGAGRPAKLYARSSAPVAVSVPPRNFSLLAEMLVAAVEEGDAERVLAVARARGRAMGSPLRDASRDGASSAELVEVLEEVLEEGGFEPVAAPPGLRLRNCPFHEVAEHHRETVCAVNLALMRGVASSCRGTGIKAVLRPEDGACCVAFAIPDRRS